jgi:hypothetical protein
VFTRFLENWEIFVINIDGTNPRRLTDATGNDLAPRWSPDGQKIDFHSERDGDFDIYTMDPSGLGVRRLTTNTDTDADASWSPNSERIVFRSTRSGPGKLYQMNADGSNVADTGVEGYGPCFTWDGREIVFESGDSLYIMRSNGTDRRSLDNTVMAGRPVCSPIPGRARQLLGPAGTDNGSDPPLGTSTRLAVIGLTDASGLVSAASLQVPNTAPLKVAKMAYGGYSLVGLSVAGTDLRGMLEDRGRGVLARRWAFPTTPATGAITVLFSATTGEIRSIMTMTDQALTTSQTKSAAGLVFQGPFSAVLDASDPSRNLAAGAVKVTVDAETGLVAGTE